MVLDEASAPSADSAFADPADFDSSDYDVNGDRPNREQAKLNLDILPRPMGILGPLTRLSWDTPGRKELLMKSVNEARTVLQRPLTQQEVDAVTQKLAGGLYIVSWCYSTGTAFGIMQTARTMDSFRFPFLNAGEKPWFNRDKFGPLRGQMARYGWHGLRGACYSGVGVIVAGMFLSSWAITRDIAATSMDPRLKEYREALLARSRQQRGGMPQARDPMRTSPVDQQLSNMEQASRDAATVPDWARARQQQQASKQKQRRRDDMDDMSPTGGAFMDELSETATDGGLMSDSQLQMESRRQEYESRANERSARSMQRNDAATQRPSQEPQMGRESPTAPGNRWERLRQEAASGGGGAIRSTPIEQRQGSTVGDEFTFSQRDEDRQLAQSEAQRDFDARLELEQRGDDFDSSRGGRRW